MSAPLHTADFQERRRARQAIVTRRVQLIDNAIDLLDRLDKVLDERVDPEPRAEALEVLTALYSAREGLRRFDS